MGKKGENLDAIGYETKGTDPSLWVEFAEGVDVGTFSSRDVDAVAACYEEDEKGDAWYAVLCVVVRAGSERDAADVLISKVATVADELLGFAGGDDDSDDSDDGGDDEPPEPPMLPPGEPPMVVLPRSSRERVPVARSTRRK